MAEEKEGIGSTVKGWVKGLATSVLGLASGAALMYLTPLVNNTIKPATPLANFSAQSTGLSVNFNNRSTGAVQGWWDFGDGSALEPFDPKLETITHAYQKPGAYSVKLALQNLIGDENDRTVTVNVDDNSAPPKIEIADFELKAINGNSTPAVYRLQANVAGAAQCILCAGDARPMEIIQEPGQIDRILTFDQLGMYTVRLAAVNGKQLVEKTQDVYVGASETGGLLAKLKVSYEAVWVERFEKIMHIHVGWQGDLQDPTSAFRKERPADYGCIVTDLAIVNKTDARAPRNLDCQASPDKTKIMLTGELVRPTGVLTRSQTAPSFLAEVKATMERRSRPQIVHRDDVSMAVAPGQAVKIPLQPLGPRWELIHAQLTLELWDNGKMIWTGTPPVANVGLTWKGQALTLTAAQQSDGVVVTLTPTAGVPALPVVLPKPAPLEMVLPKIAPLEPVLPKPARVEDPVEPPVISEPPPALAPMPPPAEPVGPVMIKFGIDLRRPPWSK